MAFLDNPGIILAHIRQSHVTSDDTGMCEMVLVDQDVDLEKCQLALVPGSSSSSSSNYTSTGPGSFSEGGNIATDPHACDLSQSMDITSSWDFGIRRRSNTGRSGGRRSSACICGVWVPNRGWRVDEALETGRCLSLFAAQIRKNIVSPGEKCSRTLSLGFNVLVVDNSDERAHARGLKCRSLPRRALGCVAAAARGSGCSYEIAVEACSSR